MTETIETKDTRLGLCTADLHQSYGERQVLHGVTLEIPNNRFTAILGPNGCGKSTLLKSLAGLLPAANGAIELDGKPIVSIGRKALARDVSTLTQGAVAPDGIHLRDLVVQGRYPHRKLFSNWSSNDEAAVTRALELTDTSTLSKRLLNELSGGQKQRGWIAMTLAQEGRILLLDEPTTFLDPAHQLEVLALIRRLIRDERATVVAVLHDLNHAAQFADHVVFLKDGKKISEGSPAAVMTPETLHEVFGMHVTMLRHPETGAPICVPLMHEHNIKAPAHR